MLKMLSILCILSGLAVFVNTYNLTEHVITAEEDETMNITCIEPTVINVISVMYGKGRRWFPCENTDQSQAFVVETCQNKSFCTMEVNDGYFRDICWFGFSGERLKVRYGCIEAMVTVLPENSTKTTSTTGTVMNNTRIQINIADQGGVTLRLQNALKTTVGITIGVMLSVIILLVVIVVLLKRHRRLKKMHREKVGEESSSQAMLIANGENNKNGLQNLYTDPDEEREKIPDSYNRPSNNQRQSQHMYSVTNRAFSERDSAADVFYSHTSVETYNTLHKNVDNNVEDNTLMYDHVTDNI